MKWLYVILCAGILYGCDTPSPTIVRNDDELSYVIVKGHQYIIAHGSSCVHDFDCPKCAAKAAATKTQRR